MGKRDVWLIIVRFKSKFSFRLQIYWGYRKPLVIRWNMFSIFNILSCSLSDILERYRCFKSNILIFKRDTRFFQISMESKHKLPTDIHGTLKAKYALFKLIIISVFNPNTLRIYFFSLFIQKLKILQLAILQ